MVDLILHAGMHKCGSTFIQNTLYENEGALRSAGIIYPRTGLALSNVGIGFRHVRLTHDIASGRQQLTEALHREIAGSGAHTAVISHEGMALPGRDPQRFRTALERYNTTVVIYGRSPADYIEALYRSSLRTGTVAIDIGAYVAERWNRLDMRPVFAGWRAAFGPARLRFFPFSLFQRGAPLANHLLEAGGIALPELRPTPQTNPRETNGGTLVHLIVNQLAHEGIRVPAEAIETFALEYHSTGRLLDDALLARMAPELAAYETLLREEGYQPASDRVLELPFDATFFDPDLRREVRERLRSLGEPMPLPAPTSRRPPTLRSRAVRALKALGLRR